jgi:hypothetical protein
VLGAELLHHIPHHAREAGLGLDSIPERPAARMGASGPTLEMYMQMVESVVNGELTAAGAMATLRGE